MREYHKINTLFKRDMAGSKKLIVGEWSTHEFEYLQNNEWEFTEKVDGTNIRIGITRYEDSIFIDFAGRTDNADIPPHLFAYLEETFDSTKFSDRIGPMMLERDIHNMVLYGEGYGPKIQGGGKYRDTPSFVLFDVNVEGWWLQREAVENVSEVARIDVVPVIGYGTLHDAIRMVSYGGLTSEWGNFISEGIVARPKVPMFDRRGERIIAKIKVRDFD